MSIICTKSSSGCNCSDINKKVDNYLDKTIRNWEETLEYLKETLEDYSDDEDDNEEDKMVNARIRNEINIEIEEHLKKDKNTFFDYPGSDGEKMDFETLFQAKDGKFYKITFSEHSEEEAKAFLSEPNITKYRNIK